jgi:Mg-chelatase subunit ChlD
VRRRHLIVALLAATGALATSAVAAVPSHVEVTEAGGAKFPDRAFVISLSSGRALTAGEVQVTENGNPVVDETLVPASLVDRRTFGTVLVLDASQSMAGRPIESAVAAARAFASRRNPNQQLALVTFNGSSKVALPFTTSKTRIETALAQTPAVAYGTFIYDAVARAERLLTDAGVQAGSIVVLSDGADTGSTATAESVAAAARAHHALIRARCSRSRSSAAASTRWRRRRRISRHSSTSWALDSQVSTCCVTSLWPGRRYRFM